jgi:hypothetical protein
MISSTRPFAVLPCDPANADFDYFDEQKNGRRPETILSQAQPLLCPLRYKTLAAWRGLRSMPLLRTASSPRRSRSGGQEGLLIIHSQLFRYGFATQHSPIRS